MRLQLCITYLAEMRRRLNILLDGLEDCAVLLEESAIGSTAAAGDAVRLSRATAVRVDVQSQALHFEVIPSAN